MASIGIIAACLFIMGMTYCFMTNIDYNVKQVDDDFLAIVVWFNEGTEESEILKLAEEIKKKTEVKSAQYISPDQAWKSMKEQLLGKGQEDVFYKGNPLKDSACVKIYLYEEKEQERFVTYLNAQRIVRKVDYSSESVNIINNIKTVIQYISLALIGILLLIGVMLIANTIKIGIYVRRNEISIMKYIGAKDHFITVPYVIEGIFIGVFGALIPFGIIYYSYDYLINMLTTEFAILAVVKFVPLATITSVIGPLFIGIGIGIGVLGSWISLKKYMRA